MAKQAPCCARDRIELGAAFQAMPGKLWSDEPRRAEVGWQSMRARRLSTARLAIISR